ncbi:acyltransferase [Marinobacter salsuginis]|uniref:acyltransferase n=1 Tax=Marinobacter salsuginis TaxID=418719 RepID=UPI0012994383|nr:acyltransferase [Marinobacter salsuginis]
MKGRQRTKRVVKNIVLVMVAPLYLIYRALSLVMEQDGCFQSFSQLLSLIPGKIGIFVRAAFYHLACPDTSDEISIGFLTLLSHRDTTIERGVYIGSQCNIGKCTIRENSLIGSGVYILSGSRQHNFDNLEKPIQEQGGHYKKIEIERDCWIGNGSVIMTNIASQTIVAAASVVLNEHSPRSIIGGHPAKLIKRR